MITKLEKPDFRSYKRFQGYSIDLNEIEMNNARRKPNESKEIIAISIFYLDP